MSDSWLTAAARYAAKNDSFGLNPQQTRLWVEGTRMVGAFVRSDEGLMGQALLAASGKFVVLVITTNDKSARILSMFVGSSGERGAVHEEDPQEKQQTIIGWGPLGPSRVAQDPLGLGIPLPPMPMYPAEFSKVVLQEGKSVEDVLNYLRSEFDKIAAEAPASV